MRSKKEARSLLPGARRPRALPAKLVRIWKGKGLEEGQRPSPNPHPP